MLYKFVYLIVILSVIYELIEFIFPAKKMKSIVKSFVLIIELCLISEFILSII